VNIFMSNNRGPIRVGLEEKKYTGLGNLVLLSL
jgi:hypothetical protein